MSDRRLIVWDSQAWFVRHVRVIEHDLDLDEKVYRCDQPIGGAFPSLADVPEIAALLAAQATQIAAALEAQVERITAPREKELAWIDQAIPKIAALEVEVERLTRELESANAKIVIERGQKTSLLQAWDDKNAELAPFVALVSEIEALICPACSNRLGFTGTNPHPYRPWQSCESCRAIRRALAHSDVQRAVKE